MRLAELAESLEDGRRRCGVCQWRCTLARGEVGRCLVRANGDDGVVVLNDGLISGAHIRPIDDFRLWHFLPGTTALALGGWGYAFPADQTLGRYARIPPEEERRRRLEPERAASFALERLCRGVIWAHGDPSVSHEYLVDLLRVCRATSRYTAIVSSGYLTVEALDQLGHYLDGISLELRAFDDAAYARLAGVEQWRGILGVVARASSRWRCHVEVTTRLHPGVNDTPEQLRGMAAWIHETLGRDTPWHTLPGDAGSAAQASVGRARRIGHETGLRFVYGPDPTQATFCPTCAALLIDRGRAGVRTSGLDNGRCASCGEDLHIRTSIFKR